MTTATSATLHTHLAQFPDVLEQLTAAHEAAWVTVDPHILELCRLRIASMLGAEAEMAINTPQAALTTEKRSALSQWPLSPLFTESEKACLAFTEEFVIDVASLQETTAVRVGELLGQQELADFVSALLVVEQRIRISLAWQTLFGENK
jgi:alkylhydroperoxidase family enzyme